MVEGIEGSRWVNQERIDRELVDVQSHWRDGRAVTEEWFRWSGLWNRQTDKDFEESLKIND